MTAKQFRTVKIAIFTALAILEIYLIYAAAASMHTYHQHPRFVSDNGQVAQSSGYRTQFYVCLVFAILIPILAASLAYLFEHKKRAKAVEGTAAAAIDAVDADCVNADVDDTKPEVTDEEKTAFPIPE